MPAADADFAIQRIGKHAGGVHHEMWHSDQAHYFLKGDVEAAKEERGPAFAEVASNTAGKPSLTKSEIIAIYNTWWARTCERGDGP